MLRCATLGDFASARVEGGLVGKEVVVDDGICVAACSLLQAGGGGHDLVANVDSFFVQFTYRLNTDESAPFHRVQEKI